MANNNESESIWVDQRLAALNSATEWQPDISRGLERLRRRQGWRRKEIWTAAAVLTTCLIVAALPQPRVFAHYCLDCTVAFWQSLSDPASSTVKLEASRKAAPDFTLNDATGRRVQLAGLRGKVVLLNFWATWCPPCVEELPSLMDMQDRMRPRGVVVLGVSIDVDDDAYHRFLKQRSVNFVTVRDPQQKVASMYGTAGWPETYIIDRQGVMRRKIVGPINWDAPEITQFLNKL